MIQIQTEYHRHVVVLKLDKQMYERHFNLQERPFRNIPDTKMFFDGGGRGEILQALHYAIKTGEGIVKVVGEVGNVETSNVDCPNDAPLGSPEDVA